jgi:hypothetical protein
MLKRPSSTSSPEVNPPESNVLQKKVPFALLAQSDGGAGGTSSNHNNIGKNNNDKLHHHRKRPRNDVTAIHNDEEAEKNSITNVNEKEERVKKIGRKTRERLNEEKNKRKEIVCIDAITVDPKTNNNNKNKKNENELSLSAPAKKSKRKTRRKKRTTATTTTTNIDSNAQNKNIDSWMPNVSNIPNTLTATTTTTCPNNTYNNNQEEEEKTSNVVRIHGLPIGVAIDDIRKFFTGLSPQRIFVLPFYNKYIDGFDAMDYNVNSNDIGRKIGKNNKRAIVLLKRYPNTMRVFVRFKSHYIARNAVLRSGEAIYIKNDEHDSHDASNVDKEKGASIVITPISKRTAIYIQNNMSINCSSCSSSTTTTTTTPSKQRGILLDDVIRKEVKTVPQIVNHFIWFMASKDLGLNLHQSTIGGNKYSCTNDNDREYSHNDNNDGKHVDHGKSLYYPSIDTNDLKDIYPPITQDKRVKLILLYNSLLDIYETMEKECTPFMIQEVDPFLTMYSPAYRLTRIVSIWILDLLVMIKKCLLDIH